MERAAVLCEGEELRPAHLLLDDHPTDPASLVRAAVEPAATEAGGEERARILAALEACAGNQTHAARMLGMSRTTLVHKLAVFRIPRPRVR
jgi:transcriptional regulator of acetoin/glycerol metabolism